MVDTVRIKDIRMLVNPYPIIVERKTSTDDIAKMLIANPRLKSVYVIDDKYKIVGQVTLKKLIKQEFMNLIPSSFAAFNALEFVGNKTAEDLMDSSVYVKDNDTLKTVFVKMYQNDLVELPVVDDNLHLIGVIDLLELLTILIEKKEKQAGKTFLSLISNRPFHQ
jgi:CBS-domain-containing membrane protein